MNQYSYNFEQLDLIQLFVSAMDGAFVYRYDANTRVAKDKIDVRYVNGPKQRVLHDLNDKAKTFTLPVVTIEQTALNRDPSRVSNKHQKMHRLYAGSKMTTVPQPIPVNCDISVSIITKFKEDLDQIVANIVTNCNPYFIVSWKVPEIFGGDFIDELRVEIEWSGGFTYENPKDLSPEAKYRIIGNTTFTIKGWMFPSLLHAEAPIYAVNTTFVDVNVANKMFSYNDYYSLSGEVFNSHSETISVSAIPQITNIFYDSNETLLPLREDTAVSVHNDNNFVVYGKQFTTSTWSLSGSQTTVLSSGEVDILSNAIVNITLPKDTVSVGTYNLVVRNVLSSCVTPFTISFA